jgi:hypothetical protein
MKRFSLHRLALIVSLLFTLTASVTQAQTACAVDGDVTDIGTPMAGNLNNVIDQILLSHGAELSRQLSVDPAIFYVKESDGPNAFATKARFPFLLAAEGRPNYDGPDGTVLFGLQLIQRELRASFGTGQTIAPILSHEFAHIAQYKYGFPYEGKWRELHADYVAGWYTAHTCRAGSCNAEQARANFFYKGGGDHGTSQERAAAFTAGFNLNAQGIDSGTVAYQYGVQYISSLAQ